MKKLFAMMFILLAISLALFTTACSSAEDPEIEIDNGDGSETTEETIDEALTEDFIEDDYVEIGEML